MSYLGGLAASENLTVAMSVLGQGFGKELVKCAELYAVERGCPDAYLDTFSFQAPTIYEKLGYRVFGTLENHPVGHQHYSMRKKLRNRLISRNLAAGEEAATGYD